MKRSFTSLWTRAVRLFRHYPLRRGGASRTGLPTRPLLEALEDRVAPGEATGGLLAVLLGVSVADPVAGTLALLGQTTQPHDSPAPAAPAAPTLPPDLSQPQDDRTLLVGADQPAPAFQVDAAPFGTASQQAIDSVQVGELLDDFWGDFGPSGQRATSPK